MTHSRLRRSRLAALAAATALVLTACAITPPPGATRPTPTVPATPQTGGTLTFGRAAAVTSFDLNNEITANNAFAIDKVFEPLVSFDTEGALIPWLASGYAVSDDQLVYSFTLRDGLLFSDGTPVTAADAKFSLERHLEVGGPLPLEAPITDISAADDHTLAITLKHAYTPFLSELSGFSNGIFPKDFAGKPEKEFFAPRSGRARGSCSPGTPAATPPLPQTPTTGRPASRTPRRWSTRWSPTTPSGSSSCRRASSPGSRRWLRPRSPS